ncbi:MAG: primosomal protein N' [Nitrospiraceae bacterium]|nr:MAG: primosomal protein N' [Nitrospiraceae bacterium]
MQANILFPINAEAFTYSVPEGLEEKIRPGMRVLAPFRRGKKVGIVVGTEKSMTAGDVKLSLREAIATKQSQNDTAYKIATHPSSARNDKKGITLKPLEAVLDDGPLVPENLLKLIKWVGEYYMSTSGLALKNAVPSGIFEGKKGGKGRIVYDEDVAPAKGVNLTLEQQTALSEINKAKSGAFLLHGVTGSGKTEVYIRAIEAMGDKEAIVLVPEIALTTQIIDRFRSRFHDKVAFFHSGLSPGERLTQWRKISDGEVRIALGVRSAVFAPFKNLGLIIIDEEHEASYKQFEGLKYSARDVALARAQIEGIKIILGSATPSIETYYHTKKGKLAYLELAHRIEQKPMPRVEIIDMTKEEKESLSYSKKLLGALRENISQGRQSLIMLNRRGYSPFLMCTDCGYTYKCPACSITLTYHKDTKTLNCHYCNSFLKPQDVCPQCKGIKIKYIGLGTQRVEEELNVLLPELTLKRMDRDTTRKKLAHYRIVKDMEDKKIDVLLGTQMVAKGHDFPDVTVAAVVFADVALNLPDFRSSERTFQLFTQLAGRAGRGDMHGEVYIQTYEPGHFVFDYVRNHDYAGFYRKELEMRRELSYPPFSRLVRIVFNFRNKENAAKIMKDVSGRIKNRIKSIRLDSEGHGSGGKGEKIQDSDIEVLGPSPAPVEKIRNYWRWHLVLKGKNAKALRQAASKILESIKDIGDIRVDVDVDPINLL